jgi:hypothetical protein
VLLLLRLLQCVPERRAGRGAASGGRPARAPCSQHATALGTSGWHCSRSGARAAARRYRRDNMLNSFSIQSMSCYSRPGRTGCGGRALDRSTARKRARRLQHAFVGRHKAMVRALGGTHLIRQHDGGPARSWSAQAHGWARVVGNGSCCPPARSVPPTPSRAPLAWAAVATPRGHVVTGRTAANGFQVLTGNGGLMAQVQAAVRGAAPRRRLGEAARGQAGVGSGDVHCKAMTGLLWGAGAAQN